LTPLVGRPVGAGVAALRAPAQTRKEEKTKKKKTGWEPHRDAYGAGLNKKRREI
jgi:hypothetical protein